MPPPNRATSPIRAAADFIGWAWYLTVMGGGLPDLSLLTPEPEAVAPMEAGHAEPEAHVEAQQLPSSTPAEGVPSRTGAGAQMTGAAAADLDLVSVGSF